MPPRKRKAEIDTSEKPAKKMKQLKAAEVKEEEIKLEGDGKFNKQEIKIISWNLNGIRAVMKKDEFLRFVGRDEFDIICFNETKLQDSHIPEIRAKLPMYGYHYWTCSKTKKGYSGAAVLSKVQPVSVAYGIGKVKHDGEGRAVTAEFDTFYVVSTYIPNAGQVTSTQKLERLDYRTREWDVDFKAYLKGKYYLRPRKKQTCDLARRFERSSPRHRHLQYERQGENSRLHSSRTQKLLRVVTGWFQRYIPRASPN